MADDLRQRYAEALKALRLNLGPNAVTLAVEGHPIGLSGNEREEAARLIEAVRNEEMQRLRYELEQWHAAYGEKALPATLERLRKADAGARCLAEVRRYIDEDFRFWCSPLGVAKQYADALVAFIDRESDHG